MIRTGEVRPDNNLTGAYARNLSHKDNVIFVRFFILKKALAIFYPFDDLYQRDFLHSRHSQIEKTFGGDAVFSRLLENKESFVMRKSLIEINRPETKRFGDYQQLADHLNEVKDASEWTIVRVEDTLGGAVYGGLPNRLLEAA